MKLFKAQIESWKHTGCKLPMGGGELFDLPARLYPDTSIESDVATYLENHSQSYL